VDIAAGNPPGTGSDKRMLCWKTFVQPLNYLGWCFLRSAVRSSYHINAIFVCVFVTCEVSTISFLRCDCDTLLLVIAFFWRKMLSFDLIYTFLQEKTKVRLNLNCLTWDEIFIGPKPSFPSASNKMKKVSWWKSLCVLPVDYGFTCKLFNLSEWFW